MTAGSDFNQHEGAAKRVVGGWDNRLAHRLAAVRWTLGSLSRTALDLIFPPHCLFCDRDLNAGRPVLLCGDCRKALSDASTRCPRCGLAVEQPASLEQGCFHCQSQRVAFQQVVALGAYRGVLREAVLRMKHSSQEALSLTMGHLLWQQRGRELAAARPTLVAPVPMHWTRRLVRNTNSAELLAHVLARRLGAPMRPRLLRRIRRTRPQGSLSATRRRENVRGAFAMRYKSMCRGASVLLVDDVLTTGSTAHEAARVLIKSGASRVIVTVLARSQSDD